MVVNTVIEMVLGKYRSMKGIIINAERIPEDIQILLLGVDCTIQYCGSLTLAPGEIKSSFAVGFMENVTDLPVENKYLLRNVPKEWELYFKRDLFKLMDNFDLDSEYLMGIIDPLAHKMGFDGKIGKTRLTL